MTNFEKLKEGLDVLFEDIETEDDLIEFLSRHLYCDQCKIFDECASGSECSQNLRWVKNPKNKQSP